MTPRSSEPTPDPQRSTFISEADLPLENLARLLVRDAAATPQQCARLDDVVCRLSSIAAIVDESTSRCELDLDVDTDGPRRVAGADASIREDGRGDVRHMNCVVADDSVQISVRIERDVQILRSPDEIAALNADGLRAKALGLNGGGIPGGIDDFGPFKYHPNTAGRFIAMTCDYPCDGAGVAGVFLTISDSLGERRCRVTFDLTANKTEIVDSVTREEIASGVMTADDVAVIMTATLPMMDWLTNVFPEERIDGFKFRMPDDFA